MKKAIVLALMLAVGPRLCPAESLETGGTIGSPLVDRGGTTKKLVIRALMVDSTNNPIATTSTSTVGLATEATLAVVAGSVTTTGTSGSPMTVTFTSSPVTGGSGVSDATTMRTTEATNSNLSVAAAHISTVAGTDQTSYNSLTTATYIVTTHTATVVNGTSTAGTAVPLQYFVNSAQGGAAIRYDIRSASEDVPSAGWLREAAWYNAATTTTQVTGRWASGHVLYMLSVGATYVTATVKLVQ